MAIGRFLFPFFAGVAVGALLHKYWPDIRTATRPMLRSSLRHGSNLIEKGRTAFWDRTERLTDLIEEIREEDADAAKGTPEPGGNPPPVAGTGGSGAS